MIEGTSGFRAQLLICSYGPDESEVITKCLENWKHLCFNKTFMNTTTDEVQVDPNVAKLIFFHENN